MLRRWLTIPLLLLIALGPGALLLLHERVEHPNHATVHGSVPSIGKAVAADTDRDHCAICQTLSASRGMMLPAALPIGIAHEPVARLATPIEIAAISLRGPPSLARGPPLSCL